MDIPVASGCHLEEPQLSTKPVLLLLDVIITKLHLRDTSHGLTTEEGISKPERRTLCVPSANEKQPRRCSLEINTFTFLGCFLMTQESGVITY